MPYICVHFKEKTTPAGEQVYFAVSKDGCSWEELNGSNPVLVCDKGEKGCRDIEIVRLKKGGFIILATDLCVAHRLERDGRLDWKHINSHGSKCLSMWKSDDLIHFSQQELIYFGRDDFGCMWAPEVFYDEENDEYLIHWGSTISKDNFTHMSIYSCTTKDFETFTAPRLFFEKDNEILDSHITKAGETYHLFYKNSENPAANMHAVSQSLYGPYENDGDFQDYMESLYCPGSYEAPTTYTLPDGRWCMLLDFFGCEKEKMGYVPFVSLAVGDSKFVMCKEKFDFPYGFKHGRVMEISEEEYTNLKQSYK